MNNVSSENPLLSTDNWMILSEKRPCDDDNFELHNINIH